METDWSDPATSSALTKCEMQKFRTKTITIHYVLLCCSRFLYTLTATLNCVAILGVSCSTGGVLSQIAGKKIMRRDQTLLVLSTPSSI